MDAELWQRAEALFLDCADLPPAERAAFVERHCADEPELRTLVIDLLRGDAGTDTIGDAIGRAAGTLSAGQPDRWRGVSAGNYTLEERIAEGGMGVIYRARRSDAQYEQEVAVKLLPTALTTDDLRARFLAERQILASLSHPGIARLIDGGETDDGVPYLIMELIDGIPIDRYCDRHQLGVDNRLALFLQVCKAVDYAHRNLVIHRDIKPSNILVSADGQPVLLDFGIARLIDDSRPGGGDATLYGARLLTPRHASPEQILGQNVTTASDVYSLGLLLYELLCGDYPYHIGATTRPRDIEDRIIGSETPAPSTRLTGSTGAAAAAARQTTVERLRRLLRGDLDTILLKALRKEPESRYGSARELADDIARYRERRPIVARPPTFTYLLSRYWARHRPAAVGIVATIVALLAGGTAATVGFLEAREAEREAVAEARNSAAISDFLVSLFQEANPNNHAGDERSVHELLQLGLERVDSELADTPVVQASVLETLSSVYKARADYPLAIDLLQRAVAVHEDGAPDDHGVRARMLNDVGDLLRIQSRHAEAVEWIERAIALHERIGTLVSDDHADAVNNLSLVYQEMGRQEDARREMERALALRRQLFEAPHPKIALSLHNLAWHHEAGGRFDEAARYAQSGIDMRVAVFGEVHPRVASTVGLLSRIERGRGDLDAAETAARRAVAIAEQIFESGHPDLSFPMYQLAMVLFEQGRSRAAADLLERVVAWERISLGPDSHDLGMSIKAYSGTLIDLGQAAEAEVLLEEALAIFERLPAGSADALADTRDMLAGLGERPTDN